MRTGCQWRHLPPPPAFPTWPTVYGYMRAFLRDGVWESIRHHFVVMLREGAGRDASPSAAIIDTQSAKTTESGGPRGWDAAKRLKGRKRHVAVDTDGLLLGVVVHAADQVAPAAGNLHRALSREATLEQDTFLLDVRCPSACGSVDSADQAATGPRGPSWTPVSFSTR